MLKNKKGFTLIEILAAVTILGILTAVAVVSVTKIIEKAKKEHYVTLENNVVSAAQSYAQQNRSVLPKTVGQKTKIQLKTLTDDKYINEVLDYSKSQCDLENSYVQVFKYSQKDYSYVPLLKCPNYKSEDNNQEIYPVITITYKGDLGEGGKAEAEIEIVGNDEKNVKLMSYTYKIYRLTSGSLNKELKNSGDILLNGKLEEKITLNLEDYTPGKIKIAVTATNIYGMTKTKSATKNFQDNTPPTCIFSEELNNVEDSVESTTPRAWIKADRKITVGCSDGNGSGCVRETYSKTFKTSARNGIITIYDNSNNSTNCDVRVYIDKTAPTVPTVTMYKWNTNTTEPTSITGLSKYESGWMNRNIYVVPSNSQDAHVGEFVYQYKTTGNTANYTNKEATIANIIEEGTSEIQWRACDSLGNCSEYSTTKTIKLDKTAPTIPQVEMFKWKNNTTRPTSSNGLDTYTNNSWTKQSVFTKPTVSNDNLSGVKEYQFTTTGETENKTNSVATYRNIEAEGESYIQWRACDKAGNCSEKSSKKTIKIDKTAPSCGTVSGGSTTWTKNDRTVSIACDESTGSGCEKTSYSKTYNSGTTKTDTITIEDKVGNSRTCSINAYVDKTSPSCGTVTGGSTSWTKNDRTVSVACSDTGGSGCEKNSFSKTYNSGTTQTDTITIKDSVGNSRTCSVNAYVDKTKPSCGTVSGDSTNWTKNNRTVSVACSDTGGSGCEKTSYSKTYNSGTTKTDTITIEDKAGNSRTCSVNAYVDKIAPTISYVRTLKDSDVVDTDGYNFDKQSDFTFEDSGSGVKYIYRAHCCVKSGETYTQNYCVSGYSAKQRVEYYYNNGTLMSGDNKAFKHEFSSPLASKTLPLKTTFDSAYNMQYAFIAVDAAGNKTSTKTWTK